MSVNRAAMQAGFTFEDEFAARWGLEQTPGSGSGPKYKLDMGQVEVVMSLKYTEAASARLTAKDLRELNQHARGPGSRDQLGVLVHRMEAIDEEVATMKVSDLFALLRGEVKLELRASSREKKLAAADPLAYLREEQQ